MMLMMSWQLALITIVIIPVVVISFRSMEKIFRAMHHHNWVYSSTLASFLSDSIKGQRIIRAHSREEQESERFADMSYRMSDAQLKLAVTENTFFPLIYLFMFVAQIIVTAVGGIMVLNGTLQVGTLLTFIVYLGMLYGPLEFMSWVSTWWSRCVDSAQRMFEIIDAKADVSDCEKPHILENMQGEITMEHVYFEYEPARPIIKDMSIHVKPGQMLGIVGKAGAGKSTMANLIARLYAKEGSIFIDGINVKDIKIENLRRNVGVVSQEIYLFIGTIADNIKYSRPDASIDEVIAAAKAASAHEFIIKLPDGYETQVGAGGQDLSGGERQRLSIARTIIQNPKILILDEATAAMDTETERNIQNSLNKLKSGRTTLAIAHRLSTLKDADYLVVIDGGKIAEYGTHMDLIKKKGEYYNLFKIQSEALRHISIGE